jgi:hypothetical protein
LSVFSRSGAAVVFFAVVVDFVAVDEPCPAVLLLGEEAWVDGAELFPEDDWLPEEVCARALPSKTKQAASPARAGIEDLRIDERINDFCIGKYSPIAHDRSANPRV